jgi:hypothetical protein
LGRIAAIKYNQKIRSEKLGIFDAGHVFPDCREHANDGWYWYVHGMTHEAARLKYF